MMQVRFSGSIVRLAGSLLLALAASGCGYTFQGSGSVLPPDIKRVAIPLIENNSTEPGLSTIVTEALRDRFDRYGVVTVVDDVSEADAVLTAHILNVKRGTRTTTSNTDVALQRDTVLALRAELRRVNGQVLWRNNNISVTKSFGASREVVVTSSADFAGGSIGAADLGNLDNRELSRGQEQEALARLAEDAAKRIYDEAVAPDF